MLRILPFALALGLALCGCQTTGESSTPNSGFSGGDGLTIEHAVVMTGGSDVTNVAAEYAWIRQHEPNAKVTGQALITQNKRAFDKLDVALPDGSTKSYYFDITSGFGKGF